MRYPDLLELRREPEGETQDQDGMLVSPENLPPLSALVPADVQENQRGARRTDVGPGVVTRDATAYLKRRGDLSRVNQGMRVVVWWGEDRTGEKSAARVVGVNRLDSRVFLDWIAP
jgi:hypothetical protein